MTRLYLVGHTLDMSKLRRSGPGEYSQKAMPRPSYLIGSPCLTNAAFCLHAARKLQKTPALGDFGRGGAR
jgi:hypothetical protein